MTEPLRELNNFPVQKAFSDGLMMILGVPTLEVGFTCISDTRHAHSGEINAQLPDEGGDLGGRSVKAGAVRIRGILG